MNPRRTFFGVSILSTEAVNGAYEGRHDIPMNMAHNTFLELWRRCGLIGMTIMIAFLVRCLKKACRIYFDTEQSRTALYMVSVTAGLLLAGMTELGPIPYFYVNAVPLMFFMACGYCMKTAKA